MTSVQYALALSHGHVAISPKLGEWVTTEIMPSCDAKSVQDNLN